MNEKYKSVCRMLGWRFFEFPDGTVKLSKRTLAGQNFFFYARRDDFAESVREYANSFNVDDYIEERILFRRTGVYVPPASELVDDAGTISIWLEVLADNLDMINPQVDDSQVSYAREEIKAALQTIVNAEPIVYNCVLPDTKEYVTKQGFYLDGNIVKEKQK